MTEVHAENDLPSHCFLDWCQQALCCFFSLDLSEPLLCYARAQEKVGSKGLSNQKISGKFSYGKARETKWTQ